MMSLTSNLGMLQRLRRWIDVDRVPSRVDVFDERIRISKVDFPATTRERGVGGYRVTFPRSFFISFPPPLKSPIHVSLLPMSRWGEVGMNRGDGRNEADIQKAKLIIFTGEASLHLFP